MAATTILGMGFTERANGARSPDKEGHRRDPTDRNGFEIIAEKADFPSRPKIKNQELVDGDDEILI